MWIFLLSWQLEAFRVNTGPVGYLWLDVTGCPSSLICISRPTSAVFLHIDWVMPSPCESCWDRHEQLRVSIDVEWRVLLEPFKGKFNCLCISLHLCFGKGSVALWSGAFFLTFSSIHRLTLEKWLKVSTTRNTVSLSPFAQSTFWLGCFH